MRPRTETGLEVVRQTSRDRDIPSAPRHTALLARRAGEASVRLAPSQSRRVRATLTPRQLRRRAIRRRSAAAVRRERAAARSDARDRVSARRLHVPLRSRPSAKARYPIRLAQRVRRPAPFDRRADRFVEGRRTRTGRAPAGSVSGPDDHVDLVSTSRQRMAGLHRLDSVCALERKPDVGEIQDAHGTHGTRAAGWAR